MKRLILALPLISLSLSMGALAEEAAHPKLQLKQTGGVTMSIDGSKMKVDYNEPVPVKDLIKTMAQASGKNVVLDREAGDAKIAVSMPEPLPKAEAFEKIVAAIEAQGLQVNDDGKVIRVSR